MKYYKQLDNFNFTIQINYNYLQQEVGSWHQNDKELVYEQMQTYAKIMTAIMNRNTERGVFTKLSGSDFRVTAENKKDLEIARKYSLAALEAFPEATKQFGYLVPTDSIVSGISKLIEPIIESEKLEIELNKSNDLELKRKNKI